MILLQLPGTALRVTRHVERGVRRRVGHGLGELTLVVVDASLSSPLPVMRRFAARKVG